MVAVYEFDDIEYRSLDWTRRVAGDSDGAGDTGVEGVEPFPWAGREGGRVGIEGRSIFPPSLAD